MTAGIQPTEMIGAQLLCRTASAIALPATKIAASPAITPIHLLTNLITSLPMSSELVIDKLA
jgi:hypothetical protein